MSHILISAMAVLLPLPLSAQFHIITEEIHSTKTQAPSLLGRVGEGLLLHDNEKAATPSPSEEDAAAKNRVRVDVAYPLRIIHVTSPFGSRRDPFTGKTAYHNGIDLRANNTEVYAMMFGQVVKVGSNGRSGNFVTVRHGDITVSYCHVSKVLVQVNQYVFAGQPVAVSGNSGRSTAPHLHLTCKDEKGRAIDPALLLNIISHVRLYH